MGGAVACRPCASSAGGAKRGKKAKTGVGSVGSEGGDAAAAPASDGGEIASETVSGAAVTWHDSALAFHVPPDPTVVKATDNGCILSGLAETMSKKLERVAEASKGSAWRELKILRVSSTDAERRLAEAVAAPLLQFAARGELKALSDWQPIAHGKGEKSWGLCEASVPPRPPEEWTASGKRFYDAVASNKFEKALRERPGVWDVRLSSKGEVRVAAQPRVAAHRAAEALLRGRGLDDAERAALAIEWRCLTESSAAADALVLTDGFSIPNSLGYTPAPPKPPLFQSDKALYDRQVGGQ